MRPRLKKRGCSKSHRHRQSASPSSADGCLSAASASPAVDGGDADSSAFSAGEDHPSAPDCGAPHVVHPEVSCSCPETGAVADEPRSVSEAVNRVYEKALSSLDRENHTKASRPKNLGVGSSVAAHRPGRPMDSVDGALVSSSIGEDDTMKATKTRKERRKEIEARLTAAGALDQKSAPSSPSNEPPPSASTRSVYSRLVERTKLKKARNIASSAPRFRHAANYWNSIEPEKRESFLEVSITDVMKHFIDSKGNASYAVLTEALSFAEEHKGWKFWLCCECGAKFSSADSHAEHIRQEHMRSLPPKLESLLPEVLGGDLAERLLSFSWKPIDRDAAVAMLEKEGRSTSDRRVSKDQDDASVIHAWPLSMNTKRCVLLERIDETFQLLLRRRCFGVAHFNKVMQFTVNELQGLPPSARIISETVERSPIGICFLDATQLERVFRYLEHLLRSCEQDQREKSWADDAFDVEEDADFQEGRFLSCDSSRLRIDRDFLARELTGGAPGNDSLNTEEFVLWLFSGASVEEQVSAWAQMKEAKLSLGMEVLRLLDKEFDLLTNECERKREFLSYQKTLEDVDKYFLKEAKRMDHSENFDDLSYEAILKKRIEELERGSCEAPVNPQAQVIVVSGLLSEAASLSASYFGFNETKSGANDDERIIWDALYVMDNCISLAIQRRKERVAMECCRFDARIMKKMSSQRLGEGKLGPALSFDYRLILIPLMKAFLLARLENLGQEYATRRSDAAREAFLKELALDEKKNVMESGEKPKSSQEKSKEKKKRRERRRSKDACDKGKKEAHLSEEEEKPNVYLVIRSATRVHRLPVPSYVREEHENPNEIELEEEAKEPEKPKSPKQKQKRSQRYQRRVKHETRQNRFGEQQRWVPAAPLEIKNAQGERFQADLEVDLLNCGARSADEPDEGKHLIGVAGLTNEAGEYNCFLNVIIQSLWHLRRFRDELIRSTPQHAHAGDPCVVCALHGVFVSLNSASTEGHGDAVAPTPLRAALSNLFPGGDFFQEGQMNDASEVLVVIFDSLHESFAGYERSGRSDEKSEIGSWDCSSCSCLVHRLFGMDLFEHMRCSACGGESRHFKYSSFFHNINANDLRTVKDSSPDAPLDELLGLVEMNHQLSCDAEPGGCRQLNHILRVLTSAPKFFTLVFGWQKICESEEDISAALDAFSAELDVGVLYRGQDKGKRHSLVCMVCYFSHHYLCFAYHHRREAWVVYDDQRVTVAGGWSDVLAACRRGRLQPQVLFFEAAEEENLPLAEEE